MRGDLGGGLHVFEGNVVKSWIKPHLARRLAEESRRPGPACATNVALFNGNPDIWEDAAAHKHGPDRRSRFSDAIHEGIKAAQAATLKALAEQAARDGYSFLE